MEQQDEKTASSEVAGLARANHGELAIRPPGETASLLGVTFAPDKAEAIHIAYGDTLPQDVFRDP